MRMGLLDPVDAGQLPGLARDRAPVVDAADRLEVRGVLHDHPAGRAPGDPHRGLRGRRHRRGHALADLPPDRDSPAAPLPGPRPDPVRHGIPACLRPVLHPDEGRPGQLDGDGGPAHLPRGIHGWQDGRRGRALDLVLLALLFSTACSSADSAVRRRTEEPRWEPRRLGRTPYWVPYRWACPSCSSSQSSGPRSPR